MTKSKKQQKRGRLIAGVMVVMTILPMGFSVLQGVSSYKQAPIQEVGSETAPTPKQQPSASASIMFQDESESTDMTN